MPKVMRFRTSIVFGNKTLYPMPEIAEEWELLTNRKTADKRLLTVLRKLGHMVLVDEGTFLIKEMN